MFWTWQSHLVSFTQHQLGCLKGQGLCYLKVYSVIFLAVQLAVCWDLSCDSQLKVPPVASLCGLGQFKERAKLPPTAPLPSTITLEVRASMFGFRRNTNIQSRTFHSNPQIQIHIFCSQAKNIHSIPTALNILFLHQL